MKNKNAGFTIIELMIATSVLSTILVMVTAMMIGIGHLYYKGVNQARVQANVRDLTDELSGRLQLSDRTPDTAVSTLPNGYTVRAYCIGNTRYSFVLNAQIGHAVQHVIWRDDTPPGGCSATSVDLTHDPPGGTTSHGTELIVPNSRLTDFSINGDAGTYQLKIGVAYGDDDLLCNNTVANDCSGSDADPVHLGNLRIGNSDDIQCRGHVGDQFCATANLSTVVVKRLNGE